ncbi:MAG: glycosyltransferase [Lewinellaceae bacterium]|nr:glycosyltransferase [Lewinellaceae bacterium]
MPENVHYIVWAAQPGGAELSVNHYINGYGDRRELFAYSLRNLDNTLYDDTKIHFQKGGAGQWQCYLQYFRYCRQYRDEIFHLLSVGPIILLLTLLAGIRNPVYHIHGTIYWKKWYKKWYLKAAWTLSSLSKVTFIANSRHSASIFHRDVLPVNPQVIYNGLEIGPFEKNRSQRTALRRMGYAGRLQPGKNVHLVIRLFEEIAGYYPDLELHIAGDGALRPSLEAQAQAGPYADRIHFLGWVQDVASFYGSIDLFVFLSAYESFGNVLAEALLTGLPVLTSDIPAFEEIHQGEKAFLLGDPDDYPTLKERFLDAVAQYPALAKKAYHLSESIQDVFDVQNHLEAIETLYEKR